MESALQSLEVLRSILLYIIIILAVSVDSGITVFLCYSYIHIATHFNSNVQLCLLVRKDIKI